MTDTYVPSPTERIREHVARYEASDGADGGTMEGRPVVILTTVGARTGVLRKSPIIRIPNENGYIAAASNAGAATNPAWYRNLTANPEVFIQDGATKRHFHAREVFGREKAPLWQVAEQYWPHFPEYRVNAGQRDIPVILLEPSEDEAS